MIKMSIKTRERVMALSAFYQDENFMIRERDGARDTLSRKQSDLDVVQAKIDLLEIEIEADS
jgi:hypothetical protein